jgi:hypothetical protein
MSPKKKAGGGTSRKNITIELVPSVGAEPNTADAAKNGGGTPDRVRWWNRTDRGHTITFGNWPFAEPPQPILVPAGAKTDWFTLYPQTPSGLYDYAIEPTINPPSGPPGEPGVLVGD